MKKIVCAISGGVDSAVAALLLKRKGFEVCGAFMKNWDLKDEKEHCVSEEDRDYAARVCRTLDIPFYELDFVKEYWNHVFLETISVYQKGKTPNPDVLCNRHIKFDAFLKHAKEKLHSDLIATGHYARTTANFHMDFLSEEKFGEPFIAGNSNLYQAVDQGKDQTFFLHRISSDAIKSTVFPIGNLLKSSVRKIAQENKLGFVCSRKESMGICFIGLRNFSTFLLDYVPPRDGHFYCLETGKLLGEHHGYFLYTIGQRAKLHSMNEAYFIAHKDVITGDMFVVPGGDHPFLHSSTLIANNTHWINGVPHELITRRKLHCQFRFMHRRPLVDCVIHMLDNDRFLIILDRPLRALTCGQSAVFYDGLHCLGGSTICNVGPSLYEIKEQELNLASCRNDADLWVELWNNFRDEIVGNNKKAFVA